MSLRDEVVDAIAAALLVLWDTSSYLGQTVQDADTAILALHRLAAEKGQPIVFMPDGRVGVAVRHDESCRPDGLGGHRHIAEEAD